jgi:predicted HTH transcriptional regulator
MKFSESIRVDQRQVEAIQRLVREGEGLKLEFKRKAAFPDKVAREIIAFANTEGGALLIGVDDDGSVPGVKYPEEEILAIRQSLQKHCRPLLEVTEEVIPINKKKFVVRFDVPISEKRPHLFVVNRDLRECYVRVRDMSVKASAEVHEIVRRSRQRKDIRFTFGEAEKKLMETKTLPFRNSAGSAD